MPSSKLQSLMINFSICFYIGSFSISFRFLHCFSCCSFSLSYCRGLSNLLSAARLAWNWNIWLVAQCEAAASACLTWVVRFSPVCLFLPLKKACSTVAIFSVRVRVVWHRVPSRWIKTPHGRPAHALSPCATSGRSARQLPGHNLYEVKPVCVETC